MFLLGHSVWGYLFSKFAGRKLKYNIPLSLALLAGILPDFDLFFLPFGLVHQTYTHSIVILGPLILIAIAIFRIRGLVISIGILSHLFTDGLVDTLPIFFPISSENFGLGIHVPIAFDAILEVGVLLLALVYMLKNGDAKKILQGDSSNIWLIIPFLGIFILSFIFAQDHDISLPTFAFSRVAIILLTLGHFLLGAVMAVAMFQGMISWSRNRRRYTEQNKKKL